MGTNLAVSIVLQNESRAAQHCSQVLQVSGKPILHSAVAEKQSRCTNPILYPVSAVLFESNFTEWKKFLSVNTEYNWR